MFQWIVKLFIKDYQNVESSDVREQYGVLCSVLSIICNLMMVIFKLLFGMVTHSVAIQADGFNNLSDMGSNIATFFGFKMSNKHPDHDHPYGHGRYEYIAGLVISFLIVWVSLSSLKDSIMKIIYPEQIDFQISALIALLVSIGIKLWMYSFNKQAGNQISSQSLMAASQDSLNDVLSTSVILLSLCMSVFVDWPIDGVMGTLVSLIVLKSGIDIFKETITPLLGQSPDKELVDEIYQYVLSFDKVIGIHDFMMHDYGPGKKYMTFHAEVNSHENFKDVHDQIDFIERQLLEKYHILTTIHMDPIDTDDALTNHLKEEMIDIVKGLNPQYSIHDFRIVTGKTHTNLIFDVLIPHSDHISHTVLKKQIQQLVQEKHPYYYCVIQIDHSYIS